MRLEQALSVLIETGVVEDLGDGVIASPDGNSEAYQKLIVLASPAQQSLERYFMALTLLAEQGSGELTSEQAVNLCYLVGQRISVLYADDLPDVFDKALFASFFAALVRTEYATIDGATQALVFDERIGQIADYARLVLNPDAMQLIHHATMLSPDEIASISAEQNKKHRR